MLVARVVGSLQASSKDRALEGVKLLMLQPVNSDGGNAGGVLVACDATQAGYGDLVYYCDGRESTLAFSDSFIAVDATVVAIIDSVG